MDTEFSRKKALVFGVLLLVFLAIPVTVYTALQQQTTSSRASEEPQTDVVAIINGEQIKKSDVRKVAEEQYPPEVVDQLALQDALLILKERKILDNAAATYGIVPDQTRVNRFKKEGFSDTAAKYQALKQQVTLAAVNSREASSIGFWNSPADGLETLSVEEQADAANQLEVGIPALVTVEAGMQNGADLVQIIEDALVDNPELAPVLALNGYIYSKLDEFTKETALYPQIYEFGSSGLNDQTRDSLFAQSEVAVISITNTKDNRAGYVFKVEKKGNVNGSNTYDEWLESQMSALVQDVGAL